MKRRRPVLGRLLVGMGVVSTIVFLSPIFPIGVEALLVGGLFFAGAAWAFAGPDFGRLAREAWAARRQPRLRASVDPLLPVQVLRLAKGSGGLLTVSEVAIALNVPLEQAQGALQACVRAGNAVEDFDVSRGYSRFRFPEFAAPEDPDGQGR